MQHPPINPAILTLSKYYHFKLVVGKVSTDIYLDEETKWNSLQTDDEFFDELSTLFWTRGYNAAMSIQD